MTDHLLDAVRPYLDCSLEDRIAFIRAPRWIGHRDATQALGRLEELLRRPPALRTRGLMLVGPYANGKTMIAERFAVGHLKASEQQPVWVVQTREGAGLAHFYASVLSAFRAPTGRSGDVGRKAEQIDRLLDTLKPRILIFDEFHNALRGRPRDVEAVLAFLRRIGRQFDVSPVLVGEVSVYDFINATDEMATRFDLIAAPRWRYDDEFLSLLDSLESALPLVRPSELSEENLAREIFRLSEGLIGEIVAVVTAAAVAATRSGAERITRASIGALEYTPVSRRRGARAREALL